MPDRTSDTWDEFIKRHGATLWGCDFLSVKAVTARGIQTLFMLAFLNLKTREAIVSKSTANPDSAWVVEQTEAFLDRTMNREEKPSIILHDLDTKFTKEFTAKVKEKGVRTNPLPKASPNLNGRCERFIGTIKLEGLRNFIIFGKRHLDYLVSEFTAYYNTHRAHMEREHLLPIHEEPSEVDSLSMEQIEVKSYVGGLVKSFERKAA